MNGSLLSLALEWQDRRGWASAEVGNLLAAARLQHQAQDAAGSLVQILYGQCLHLLARRQPNMAYEVAQSLWQINQLPNQSHWRAELHLLLGTVLLDLGKAQLARSHFQRGLSTSATTNATPLIRFLPFDLTPLLHFGAAVAASALDDDAVAHLHLAQATAFLDRQRA